MLAGIGLNQDPWTNVTQSVNLTTTQQTFELSLTSNFASSNSRVDFDMGADTGQVVIDDVELVLDTPTAPAGGPTVAASVPTALAANVKSIFSDSYSNVTVDQWGPDWGPASARITDGVIAGNNYKTIDMSVAGKEFAGISFVSSKFDATAYTTFHIDYWIDTPLLAGQVLNIKLSNHDGSVETSAIQTTVTNITGGSWQRLSIPLTSFTVAGGGSASRNNIAQIIITAARANTAQPVKVYFDNLYFSQPAPAPVATNLLTNGDFSNGTTGWSGNAANVQTEGGNSFNFANVTAAGNPYDVNLSYVLDIPNSGVGYKLRFKASSDRARTMLAGIGLNQDPWTNVTQTVNLTTTQQTFELSLTSNFASATSRVIFDMGAAVGTVVIDDVELVLDTPTAPAPASGPTVAASVPTALAANVKSIFSDSYTNVAVNDWGPNWGDASARITDGAIASNNYKTIDMSAGQEFAGISFVSSKFDATPYTTFNVDYWVDTPLLAGQVINIKLSNHDGSAETNAIQYLVNPVTAGSWQRLSIPLSSFTVAGGGSASRNNIAQIIITAARANVSTTSVKVYFDNMYFSQ
jgi:endoglucanase